jgi:hypothetical protein
MSPYDWLAVIAGLTIVAGTTVSVVKTLVVPRRAWSFVPRTVEGATTWVFMTIARRMRSYDLIDRFLGFLGPSVLILQLLVWLGLLVLGFALLLIPSTDTLALALAHSGSSTFTLGITSREPGATTAVDVAAGAAGLIVIALTIAYLPAIYQVIRRRAVLSKQLANRVGSPAWGPQILSEHHSAGAMNVLPRLYADWDRWACEVADGHTKYPVLNQFRLPRSRHHWLLSLVAMMDAAAMDLSVRRAAPPEARLFLRSAIACINNDLASSMRISTESGDGVALTEKEFTDAIRTLVEGGYPCDVPTERAWTTFVEWRETYAATTCRILDAVVAPDAPWTNGRTLPLQGSRKR